MDYDNDNSDRDPEQVNPAASRTSKIALAALSSAAVVLVLVGLDVALVGGAQATPPRPVVQVMKLSI